ncbi:MAG TPA: hypothetical protein VGP03_14950 [Pseudonocardiaceae bacterium]|nr:hypothetical protein [Pseudonocardiaceae bacterium]
MTASAVARRDPVVAAPGPVRRSPRHVSAVITPVLALAATAVWFAGLRQVPPTQMGSYGLAPELSPVLLASYPMLVGAMAVELLRTAPRPGLLAALTALGVGGVYGLQPASQQIARLPVSWLHQGFTDYIAQHGHALIGYDARFSWPGFFSLFAFVERASGSPDPAELLRWTPVVIAALATLGVRALAATVLGDGRAGWLATWLFVFAEWTEQDYFSPQAVTYVLFLAALALVVRYLVRPGLADPSPAHPSRRLPPLHPPRDRLLAQALVVLIALALAPSHQLTPFLLAALLFALLIVGRLWTPWLPVLVLAAAVVWFALGARDFWLGQLSIIINGLGDVGSSAKGVTDRVVGETGRLVILGVRASITATVFALAVAGWCVLRHRGVKNLSLAMLSLIPFAMIVLQPYGGEILFRCYLFALPGLVLLGGVAMGAAADRMASRRARNHSHHVVAAACAWLVLLALASATVVARGGNDAYTSMSRADLMAAGKAHQIAGAGQSIDVLVEYTPLLSAQVGQVRQESLTSVSVGCPALAEALRCVKDHAPTYLLVTPSQENYGRIFDDLPPGWTNSLVRQLTASGSYRVVFEQDGSVLLANEHSFTAAGTR